MIDDYKGGALSKVLNLLRVACSSLQTIVQYLIKQKLSSYLTFVLLETVNVK